jgi:hypothetical protein
VSTSIPIDARAPLAVFEWKENEYLYCVTLLRTNGNKNVPREAIRAYFDVQIADAMREQRADVAAALCDVLTQWRQYHEAQSPPRSPIS